MRSLLLLLAAPLAVHAGGARAAAGLRRAAHKAVAAGGTAKTPGTPTPTQRVLDAMRLSLQRWDKVETKRGAQDYVRDPGEVRWALARREGGGRCAGEPFRHEPGSHVLTWEGD